ncbi:hypothetical protein [Streptomyces europaeiscabiei]|uniref:hypothetical protein n=1 Tax=Streptomyces europaeiscabiei TaxID=146819 RepID=UPI0029AD10EC|nr:hypothetical protein [Streptomyces europaeiscabiei]MDX3841270.1 hypothetical protein [Streptomyces europaeiscabiei]
MTDSARIPVMAAPGPAQSEELIHFTSRGEAASFPGDVPAQIRDMKPWERLDKILGNGELAGFPPFGAPGTPCSCFSESPPEHLAHLIADRGFAPWGIVLTRTAAVAMGGGAVAYVPDEVHARFVAAGLGHWAVRVGNNSQWTHEREWRIPLSPLSGPDSTQYGAIRIHRLSAILVGDPDWRPTPVTVGWAHGADGTQAYPNEPGAVRLTELPELWRTASIWVWNAATRKVDPHQAGALV